MPQVPNLEESYRKCRELADSHYENFPVAKMVPKKMCLLNMYPLPVNIKNCL